jgi:predicted ribosomally synthesized peptide with nif11-like leader
MVLRATTGESGLHRPVQAADPCSSITLRANPGSLQLERKNMSAANVKEFFAKVEGDKSLQAKLKALHKKTTDESRQKAADEVVGLAAAAGFKFSASDLGKAGKEQVKKAKKLSDVTGQNDCGYGTNYFCDAAWQCGNYTYH